MNNYLQYEEDRKFRRTIFLIRLYIILVVVLCALIIYAMRTSRGAEEKSDPAVMEPIQEEVVDEVIASSVPAPEDIEVVADSVSADNVTTDAPIDNGYWITLNATAYDCCYSCCQKLPSDPCYGITATGVRATAGRTIAVDPRMIPYGSKVTINGHTYIAEDCGGAIRGNRVDIYFDTHAEALAFGRQTVTAYITTA